MTAPIPTLVRAKAIAEIIAGAKPADVAERLGVTVQAVNVWRRAVDSDEELRAALAVALRTITQGWRPRVAGLVVRLVEHAEQQLANPDALDAETTIGAIRSLVAVLAEVDHLARRHGLDDAPPAPPPTPRRDPAELDS